MGLSIPTSLIDLLWGFPADRRVDQIALEVFLSENWPADNRLVPDELRPKGIAPTQHTEGPATGEMNEVDTYALRNDGRVFFQFAKTGDGAATVTIPLRPTDPVTADRIITVPANGLPILVGPFPPRLYNQTGRHDLVFTVVNAVGLTCVVLRQPQ